MSVRQPAISSLLSILPKMPGMDCMSATAERDGMELIAVVMRSPTVGQRFEDAKALLESVRQPAISSLLSILPKMPGMDSRSTGYTRACLIPPC